MMSRILRALFPGGRERRDGYIAAAGARVVASPVWRWHVVDRLEADARVG